MYIQIEDGVANAMISGGADSTLLVYLLMKQEKTVRCFSMVSPAKAADVVIPALQYLEAHFGKKIEYINRRLTITAFRVRDQIEYIQSIYPGYIYTGCNKITTGLTPTVYIPGDTPPWRGPPANEFHIRPFIDVEKHAIIQIYKDDGILDLLGLTHSCGATVVNYGRCQGCYFCLERQAAIDVVGIEDINRINHTP